MRGHHRRARGSGSMGLQIRQTDRIAKGLRGGTAAPKVDLGAPEAHTAMKNWFLCAATAAILSMPVLGVLWPTLAVSGGIWMACRFARRRS